VFAGRASKGVRGMKLGKGDEVMSMSILKREAEGEDGQSLLCVSEKGMGKRTNASEYRTIGRGGQGVVNMKLSDKTGDIVATFPVTDDHQVMLISDLGQMIRMPVKDVRTIGRATQGVTLFKVAKDEKVVSVAWLVEEDDEEDVIDGEEVAAGESEQAIEEIQEEE
jgi:DNA gyrase subunit A